MKNSSNLQFSDRAIPSGLPFFSFLGRTAMKKQILLKRTCLGNVVQFTFNLFSHHWRN